MSKSRQAMGPDSETTKAFLATEIMDVDNGYHSRDKVISKLEHCKVNLEFVDRNTECPYQECVGLDDSVTSSSSSTSSWSSGRGCVRKLEEVHAALDDFFTRHRVLTKKMFYCFLLLGYSAYFIAALVLDFRRAMALFVITILVTTAIIYRFVRDRYGGAIHARVVAPMSSRLATKWSILRWINYLLLVGAIILFLCLGVRPHHKQLVSLAGLLLFLLLLFVFSRHPAKVQLRPVVWGLGIQFILGVVILQTSWGFAAFRFLGKEIQTFLSYTDVGAKFVFGESYMHHFFAFKVLPVIIFFSCAISSLYHLGVMQYVIDKIAWLMQVTMGTTATESLTAAGNIFLGQTEAPILVGPYIEGMTKSELHAMMTGGFATISGGVLAAYILLGIPAEHLLCASVMNAPVGLAVSKLFYPEVEISEQGRKQEIKLGKGKERNLLEAASAGASSSIMLVANIAANLIAFLAMLAFLNATLGWLGGMVGYPQLSFQLICSYAFMPIAYLMGVDWKDCQRVAELLGIKLFINEFVAYQELSKFIANRKNCVEPQISVRSEIISTYALCGFANISAIGIQLGGIGPMAPSRKGDLAELALRAMIAGAVACLITASVAGVLTVEEPFLDCLNSTSITNNTLIQLQIQNATLQ